MHEHICTKFHSLGKQLVKDKFGGFHVVDDFVEIDGREFLVEFFNKNSIQDILQRSIGFCFMAETLFNKDYGKIILYKTLDGRDPQRFNLGKILKDRATVISLQVCPGQRSQSLKRPTMVSAQAKLETPECGLARQAA